MSASVRRRFGFGPLQVKFARARVALSAAVRGSRVPISIGGIYVSFRAGFAYGEKADDASALAPSSPSLILRSLNERARRWNFFKAYLIACSIILLLSLLSSATTFVVLLVILGAGGVFVLSWNRERRTSRIIYDVDNDEIVGRLALCNVAGDALARTANLWHVYTSATTLDRKHNAGAGYLIRRAATRCWTNPFDGIELNVEAWSIPVGPQRLLFLPDALFIQRESECFAIGYEHLTAVYETTRFVEEGKVPRDSEIVGSTWRFVNKSGGPDRRFSDNRQVPIVAYGELTIVSSAGQRVVLQSSHPGATQLAAAALQELSRIARGGSEQPQAAQSPVPPPHAHPRQALQPAPAPAAYSAQHHAPVAYVAQPPRPPAPPIYVEQQPYAYAPRGAVPIPPPPPIFRPRSAPSTAPSSATFYGPNVPLRVGQGTIPNPMTYAAPALSYGTDASTIVTSLPLGRADRALPLPYWPRYSEADPDQRTRYLEWMAAGRSDPDIAIGYVFIFFYGLERRVLIEREDEQTAKAEVERLLRIYGNNGSFRSYASEFLAFAPLRRVQSLSSISQEDAYAAFHPLAGTSHTALAALAAWHYTHRRPLPADVAANIASMSEDAKRGVVVTRSADELLKLFSKRYRDSFGEGIVVDAAKRALRIQYRPASPSLLSIAETMTVLVPDVMKRVGQFRKAVYLWNDCIDDLRKTSSRKRDGRPLDADGWAALPADLRNQYDHPDQDRWDVAISNKPHLAGFRLTDAGSLAALTGIEPSPKLTATQMKRIATRASDVGYVVEPDPRVRAKAMESTAEVLIWRAESTAAPEPKSYAAITAMLSLTMAIALADGVFTNEEQDVVNGFLSELFTLDDPMRVRIEAMKQLMARDPSRLASVAKTLRSTRSATELEKVGTVLVAVAAADGTIADSEEKALRALYRSLGLPAAALSGALARTGAKLERDALVEGARAEKPTGGVPIPPPPGAESRLQLDQNAIDAIMADTKDVAAILAEVFDAGVDANDADDSSAGPASAVPSSAIPRFEPPTVSASTTSLAQGLDVRYHGVLERLLTRATWTKDSVRELAAEHRLMPGAILETINSWSDEVLGDFLIEDDTHWTIHRELVKVQE